MNRTIPQSVPPTKLSKPPFEFASVPWYTDSIYYEHFRSNAIDSDSFFSTFVAWLAVALEHERQAEFHGFIVIRIRMFPEPFQHWCESSGAQNDAAGRTAYAEDCAEKLWSY